MRSYNENNNVDKEIVKIITEELNKTDVIKIAKTDKDFEKRVREIVSEVVTDLFKILWQHNGLFKNLIK